MKWIYFAILMAAVFAACETAENVTSTKSNEEIEEASVIKPIEVAENHPTVYKIKASEASTIELSNGGSIEFDANSFVDAKGKPVKGEVDIAWQEFHSLGDIMLSGIPMKYDSAGVKYDLVSGGMFTIKGSQKGTPVEIAPNKDVTVNLASIQDTPCYNFYELDEKTGAWDYETTAVGKPIVEAVNEEITDAATPMSKTTILDVTLDTRRFQELQGKDIVGWKVLRPMTLQESSIAKLSSSKIRLLQAESGEFSLDVRTSGNQSILLPVEPYLMEDATADSKKNREEFNKSQKEVRDFALAALQGKVIRSIDIDGFGTYNWDYVHMLDNPLELAANFNFPKSVNPQLVSVFLVAPETNAIVAYDAAGDKNFSFDPTKKHCLVAILPGNELVSVSDKGFNAARAKKKGQSCDFDFVKTGIKLKSSRDIMNHLHELI